MPIWDTGSPWPCGSKKFFHGTGMPEQLTIGLLDQQTKGWSAGASFTRILLKSLELCNEKADDVILLTTEAHGRYATRYPIVQIPPQPTALQWLKLRKTHGIDVVLPVRTFCAEWCPLPKIGWIPDLQHKCLKHFFSEREIQWRDRLNLHFIEACEAILFSSNAAKNEFDHYHPAHKSPGTPCSFASVIWSEPLASEPQLTVKKYHLPGDYILVPNQFWKHKNHGILPAALEMMARNSPDTPMLVLTGLLADGRDPTNKHLSDLLQEIASRGLAAKIQILGHVPYSDLVNLIRQSSAILQPSLCEGWSTTIEDAKALGVPLICSDLPVHREQAPQAAGFFDPADAQSLAEVLHAAWPKVKGSWASRKEAPALEQARGRCRQYGMQLRKMSVDAIKNAGDTNSWRRSLPRVARQLVGNQFSWLQKVAGSVRRRSGAPRC